MDLKICYLNEANITEKEYIDFLSKYHGKSAYFRYKQRGDWYKDYTDYKILIAQLDGKIIGQSCGYKTNVISNRKRCDFWWGIDTFVLPEARGLGIGKKLQQRLHTDLPNFSSAWYSPANGHIKRKCGAHGLFNLRFNYYPVSSFFSVLYRNIIKGCLKKISNLRLPIPYFYYYINCFGLKKFNIEEIEVTKEIVEDIVSIMSTSNFDFYVERTWEYLDWKYNKNPSLRYHFLKVSDKNFNIVGYISFSEIHDCICVATSIKGVKLLDIYIKDNTKFTNKDATMLIAKYYKNQGRTFDGILSLSTIFYFPKLIYPYPSIDLLSTMESKTINNGYLSYIDQDMEQMDKI